MKKIITATLLIASVILSGCSLSGNEGIVVGENQQYYIADLLGDPNNRNILRATTVFSPDTTFEILIPDYWEVKEDKKDEYNTDIYLVSDENEACVLLPGTRGYGIPEEYEKDLWYTTVAWGAADDYFFYERISEEERKPVIRIAEFNDGENIYIFELRFPEEDYETCNKDFSDMITTFNTLDIELEETYIEEEIFQAKWIIIAIPNYNDENDQLVVDYPPTYKVEKHEELQKDYIFSEETGCEIYVGVEDRDLSEAASYEEDVIVFDNNDMGQKYLLYDAEGNLYMEVVSVVHNDIKYNFELKNPQETCIEDFEAIVTSFRTYDEHRGIDTGYNIFEHEDETTLVPEEATEETAEVEVPVVEEAQE